MYHSENPQPPSLIGSLKNLGSTLVSILETRLALLCTELEEEREHAIQMVILGIVSVVFLILGLVVATFFVVVLFWDSPYRLHTLGIVAGVYFAISASTAWKARAWINQRPRFLDATLTELEKDSASLRRPESL